jgi:hypothetical protein
MALLAVFTLFPSNHRNQCLQSFYLASGNERFLSVTSVSVLHGKLGTATTLILERSHPILMKRPVR